jgi:parvulin-like peptidyl-prolyl isomerase
MTSSPLKRTLLLIIILALGVSACAPDLEPTATSTPTSTQTATITPTITATPVPLAATVNGEGITQAEYQAELARFHSAQAALGKTVAPEDASRQVLDDLVSQVLLARGAQAAGFSLDEAALQERVDRLAEQVGGAKQLAAWEAAHGYSDESFRLALRRQILAAWMRDTIVAAVPEIAEQVHVQQILFYNSDIAQQVLGQLKAGADFAAMAALYDPATQGELGWFPRGYLLQPEIETAAFALQPGEISDVIQTSAGYHILKVLARDPAHLLSPDARLTLQEKALAGWLQEQQTASTIVLTP